MDTQQDPEQLVHNFISLKIKAVHDLSKSHKWSHSVLLFGFSVTADDTLRGYNDDSSGYANKSSPIVCGSQNRSSSLDSIHRIYGSDSFVPVVPC